MFVDIAGIVYRVLRREDNGAWIIPCEEPRSIRWLDAQHMKVAARVENPDWRGCRPYAEMSGAEQQRFRLIEPLLQDDSCICDTQRRLAVCKQIAADNGTTRERVQRLYFAYLATGYLMKPHPKRDTFNEEFDWAIRTFYFTARKTSLRTAYDLMILSHYTNPDGTLMDEIPTWSSFEHYYERHGYAGQSRKHISRNGLESYMRDKRATFGSAMAWRSKIGSYQMDATEADVYLVSRLNRSEMIGRPHIILAVDTATQLITGVCVGLDASERAVMACIANAVADKREFCGKYGIDPKDAWPSRGMPSEIITDKGREFLGGVTDELCIRYGVTKHALPSFRPDNKGIVEKTFDLLQKCYVPFLMGKGAIGEDCQERWATDYRKQAVLTLPEFTKIVIYCILYLNRRVLSNTGHLPPDAPQTPAGLWDWYLQRGESTLLDVNAEDVRCMSLPRISASLKRQGFCINGVYYIPENAERLEAGARYQVAYDINDTNTVYAVLSPMEWERCRIAERSVRYRDCTVDEVARLRQDERRVSAAAIRAEQEEKNTLFINIQSVIDDAKYEAQEKGPVTDIKDNRSVEKELRCDEIW